MKKKIISKLESYGKKNGNTLDTWLIRKKKEIEKINAQRKIIQYL